jgi:hypothetical protein
MDRRNRASIAFYSGVVNDLLDGMWKKALKGDGKNVRRYLKDVLIYMEKVPASAAPVTMEHMKLRAACSQTLELINACERERRNPSEGEAETHFAAIREARIEWLHSLGSLLSS